MNKLLILITFFYCNLHAMDEEIKGPSTGMSKDEIIITIKDADLVLRTCLGHDNSTHARAIRPYLREVLHESADSPIPTTMQNMIHKATAKALESQQKEIEKRVTKARSVTYSAIASVVSTSLTAAVALIIHYNSN